MVTGQNSPPISMVFITQRGSREWRRELAALVIQLAWRQYQRRKLLAQALRRQRVLHDWTPSVLAARQKALVQKVYGKRFTHLFRGGPNIHSSTFHIQVRLYRLPAMSRPSPAPWYDRPTSTTFPLPLLSPSTLLSLNTSPTYHKPTRYRHLYHTWNVAACIFIVCILTLGVRLGLTVLGTIHMCYMHTHRGEFVGCTCVQLHADALSIFQ